MCLCTRRELLRVKRDADERTHYEEEQLEIERRRNMTDEERKRDDMRHKGKEQFKEKTRMKFLQKYYHKGAFYQVRGHLSCVSFSSSSLVNGAHTQRSDIYGVFASVDRHHKEKEQFKEKTRMKLLQNYYNTDTFYQVYVYLKIISLFINLTCQ